MRGLKLLAEPKINGLLTSHPLWVRGLKYCNIAVPEGETMSHPLWVRGLKWIVWKSSAMPNRVAPLVGAWIEINTNQLSNDTMGGRTPCGCVD